MKTSLLFKGFVISAFYIVFTSSLTAQTVFVSSKGKKYHAEGCPSLGKDKHGIKIEEAEKEGYKAHKRCKAKQIEAIEKKEAEEKMKKNG